MARGIVQASDGAAILAPETDLGQLAALLGKARLLVTSDTGPMHIAAAVGTTCVALFGPTLPGRSGPVGSRHVCIQKRYQEGSGPQRRGEDNSAMCEITVDDVLEGCLKIVS
jgi:ADP-heptose:LPS heptosyltransferase